MYTDVDNIVKPGWTIDGSIKGTLCLTVPAQIFPTPLRGVGKIPSNIAGEGFNKLQRTSETLFMVGYLTSAVGGCEISLNSYVVGLVSRARDAHYW